MKSLITEFKSSVYNPNFYRDINDKSLRNIFIYILKIDLIVSIAYATFIAIYTFSNINEVTQVASPNLTVTFILGFFSTFVTIFLTLFILWVLYGLIFGILILVVSIIVRKRLSYTVSVKTSYYAISLGAIIMVIPKMPDYVYILGIVLSVLIVILNIRKRS